MKNLIKPSHIGDGLYFLDKEYCIEIAVNHHLNTVAVLDINDLDKAIEYLQKVKTKEESNHG
jgi:hypothetical protein